MNELLKRVAVTLEKKQNSLFSYDINKQKKIISRYKEPKDTINRSYLQYKCQMKLYGPVISFFLNLFSYPLLIALTIKLRLKSNCVHYNVKKCEAVFFRDGKPENILPKRLAQKYKTIEKNPIKGDYVSHNDFLYLFSIFLKHPLSPFYILKSLIKIARYKFCIDIYNPKAIIVCAEYSFTSSLLTDYCRKNNIKHINIMHGEKLYFIRDSFFEFDECFIWDIYYKKLFVKLRANKEQFTVEVPQSIKFKKNANIKKIYDYTYYLAAEQKEVLAKIAQSLKCLYNSGKKISIRPHPRYSDLAIVSKLFNFANIEDTSDISIEASLLRTRHAISLYSTVLNQAICNSVKIVIDDISNKTNYLKLSQLEYICLDYDHELLSSIMEEIK